MVCSEGSVGMPQNIMLVSMVHNSREKQHDTRCTRVKVLLGGRLITENQMCPSRKSFAVFMKNRLLECICEHKKNVELNGLNKHNRVSIRRAGAGFHSCFFLETSLYETHWIHIPESLQICFWGNRENLVKRELSHVYGQPGITKKVPFLPCLQVLHHHFVDIPAYKLEQLSPVPLIIK